MARPHRHWRHRLLAAGLATIGLGISSYLAAVQLGLLPSAWDPFFGPGSSSRALHSALSRALPIPDALLGAAGYALEVTLDLLGGRERWRTAPWLVLAFGALAAAMALVGVGLVLAQAIVVRAGCTLCLASAAMSVLVCATVAASGEAQAAFGTVSARASWRQAR